MKFYKVVSSDLHSSRADFSDVYRVNVKYEIGKWTHAPIHKGQQTKLFVFDNLEDAILFKSGKDIVYSCGCRELTQCTGSDDLTKLSEFWKRFNESITNGTDFDFTGLYQIKDMPSVWMAGSIKLLNQIW